MSGSTMIISSLVGRLDPSEKHQTEVYKYTHEFYERFYNHFGSACCSQLNKLSFGTPEYRTKCIKLTAEAADMVSDYIMEKGLLEFKILLFQFMHNIFRLSQSCRNVNMVITK